jgi:YspA, cpYpsA-related SLOG family
VNADDQRTSSSDRGDRQRPLVDREQLAALRRLRQVFGGDQVRVATAAEAPAPPSPSGPMPSHRDYRGWPLTGSTRQLHAAVDALRADTLPAGVELPGHPAADNIASSTRPSVRPAAWQLELGGDPRRPVRLLVCGDRAWTDLALVAATLDQVVAQHVDDQDVQGDQVVVIEGDARGADRLAARHARARGWQLATYPADWAAHGRAAGPRRNQRMLRDGRPDLVVAFHDQLAASRGTADLVRRARAAGLPVLHVLQVTHRERTRDGIRARTAAQRTGPARSGAPAWKERVR